MQNKKIILTALLAGSAIIVFGAGFWLGDGSSGQSAKSSVISALRSKAVPSIMAYGKVAEINGNKITLTAEEEKIEVIIEESAVVQTFNQSAYKNGQFSDIKIGDILSMALVISPENKLEAKSVTIFAVSE